MFYRLVERFRLKERRYCQAVRELVRCFNLPDPSLKMATWEVRMMLRDLLAMLLEFDNAYRFRFQDMMDDHDVDSVGQIVKRKAFTSMTDVDFSLGRVDVRELQRKMAIESEQDEKITSVDSSETLKEKGRAKKNSADDQDGGH